MNSSYMTLIGAINAGITFALLDTPEFVPDYLRYILGIAATISSFLMGTSHRGVYSAKQILQGSTDKNSH